MRPCSTGMIGLVFTETAQGSTLAGLNCTPVRSLIATRSCNRQVLSCRAASHGNARRASFAMHQSKVSWEDELDAMSARQDNREEIFGREQSGLSLDPDDLAEDWHDAEGKATQLFACRTGSHAGSLARRTSLISFVKAEIALIWKSTCRLDSLKYVFMAHMLMSLRVQLCSALLVLMFTPPPPKDDQGTYVLTL